MFNIDDMIQEYLEELDKRANSGLTYPEKVAYKQAIKLFHKVFKPIKVNHD